MVSFKDEKEAFVTGHQGTTPWELMVVCSAVPLGLWIFGLLIGSGSDDRKKRISIKSIALEALVLLLPTMICQTSYLYSFGLFILIFELVVGLVLFVQQKQSQPSPTDEQQEVDNTNSHTRPGFVTCYRAAVLYLTFIAILAVDFSIFPRRFAKTETTGFGLMDLGAGSFVIAAGFVSQRARRGEEYASSRFWQKNLRQILPLLLLGMLRLVTTKGIEYQEHVSEYGVHWNFFFTLALMQPTAVALPLRSEFPIIVISSYQWFLSKHNIQGYIEDAPRKCTDWNSSICNVIAANREGILGILGYLTLYLSAELVGKYCVWIKSEKQRIGRLFYVSGGLWVATYCLITVIGIPVSRRSTNASFCLWCLAHNVSLLALLSLVCRQVPPVLSAINNHGLMVFVVANLLTGLVNLSINTIRAPDGLALLVLSLYLFAIAAVALIVERATPWFRKGKKE